MSGKTKRKAAAGCEHQIARGETLSGIAAASNQDMNALYERNRDAIGSNPDHIEAGSYLDMCGGSVESSSGDSSSVLDGHGTVVNDGQTLLLRATGDSDRRRRQYQSMAKSETTGSILLRSF